jgi:hypothetical protein
LSIPHPLLTMSQEIKVSRLIELMSDSDHDQHGFPFPLSTAGKPKP